MQARDLSAVMQIQLQCYAADVLEDEAVISRRLQHNPQQCWVAEDSHGVCGYLFAYPSRLGSITPLDGDFARHSDPDCLYLHDLAVAGRAGGRGIGPRLVAHGLAHAREQALPYSALVSVQDSAEFWARQGFDLEPELTAEQRECLESYRIPARYLVQPLAEAPA